MTEVCDVWDRSEELASLPSVTEVCQVWDRSDAQLAS